jgi:basic amino acid/polyamine antiporter, APA family
MRWLRLATSLPSRAASLAGLGPLQSPRPSKVGWALVLLWTGSFESILIYTGVGLALFSMLSVSSIYVLRRTHPDLPRPFRTPGYPFVPAIFLAASAILTIAAFVERPWVSLYSLLSILAGIPVYSLCLRPRRQTLLAQNR